MLLSDVVSYELTSPGIATNTHCRKWVTNSMDGIMEVVVLVTLSAVLLLPLPPTATNIHAKANKLCSMATETSNQQ